MNVINSTMGEVCILVPFYRKPELVLKLSLRTYTVSLRSCAVIVPSSELFLHVDVRNRIFSSDSPKDFTALL